MGVLVIVARDSYHDSVLLMRLSRAIGELPGVDDAAVVMGTPANRDLLAASGYADPALAGVGPNDLVIAARGPALERAAIQAELGRLLAPASGGEASEIRPTSLRAALRSHPEANFVLVSVPGEYAAAEARHALAAGRHVMLFSDNVPLEAEIALKRQAAAAGLLLMGPDCGTAIINGLPLGFANAVRRGSIGLVGAAGTGTQEVTSLVHRGGGGISQAIGTGGRDLSEAVGGATMLAGIAALADDPATAVIIVISKPPARAVADKVVAAIRQAGKPAVIHFVGAPPGPPDEDGRIVYADSLADAARQACRLAGIAVPEEPTAPDSARVDALAAPLRPDATLRGLFCGGTTGQEALFVLERAGHAVRSNLHKTGPLRIEGLETVGGHVLLDLGDDVFTRGRPHPMLEPALRSERLAAEMADPTVGLLLFDCVIGYGSHPDPAGILARDIERARAQARARGREILAIASVTGTPLDPQDSRAQASRLEAAGILVEPSNYAAARLAAAVLSRIA